jgi:hypothetical protein
MEPFRPVVDRAVLDMEDFPSSAARQRIVAILDDKFDDTSTRIAVQESAEAFALYVEGDSEEFSAPEMAA